MKAFLTASRIPEKVKDGLKKIHVKDLIERMWRIRENPFIMNGLPYVLWRYDVKPSRING